MIKQQVNINGVPTMVFQSELTRKILGQDEEGNDILGDFYKYYNEDMIVDTVKEAEAEAEVIKQEADTLKKEALDKLIVTNVSGIRFYADPESRTDLLSAVLEALENNLPDTYETEWKTPDGKMMVTVKELKEAKTNALASKAEIIGVQ